MAAAKDVFAERGLDATMDEVARRAGVGVGTAYRRFRNRDDLIAALFEERLDEYMRLLDEALADRDPWSGLRGFLERSMEMQAEDRGFKELLLQSAEGPERVRCSAPTSGRWSASSWGARATPVSCAPTWSRTTSCS